MHQGQCGFLCSLRSVFKAVPQSLALQQKAPHVMIEQVNPCKVLRAAPGTKQELNKD